MALKYEKPVLQISQFGGERSKTTFFCSDCNEQVFTPNNTAFSCTNQLESNCKCGTWCVYIDEAIKNIGSSYNNFHPFGEKLSNYDV